jgi:hypothetical protein
MPKSSCAAEVVHTWTYNDHIIAQLRWCGGRPRHHVTANPDGQFDRDITLENLDAGIVLAAF